MGSRRFPPHRFAFGLAWLAFVWATTRWYEWQRTVDLLFGADMPDYERIAQAAPGLTAEPMSSQHADRFVPHYVVGLGADVTGLGLRPLYYVCAFALLVLVVALVHHTLASFRLGPAAYGLCIGALVANPYLFRFLAICPARLGDTVFVSGGLLALLGLVRGGRVLLVSGLLLATLGRSEAAFPLIALAPIGVALSPRWRRRPARERYVVAASALVVPLTVYAVVRVAARSFSESDYPGFFALTVFGSVRDLPESGGRLGLHVARILVGIAGAGAVLLGTLIARRRSRAAPLPFEFWAALTGAVAVSGEAFVLNPAWLKGSEPLLASFGAALLVIAAAASFESLGHSWSIRPSAALAAVVGLAGTSLHHRFAEISPVSTPGQFAALAAASAVLVAVAVAGRLAPKLAKPLLE